MSTTLVSSSKMATAKTILSAVGSVAAATMVARSVVPDEIQDYILSGFTNLFKRFSTQLTIVIDEFEGYEKDELYEAAKIYLGTKTTPHTRRLKARKPENEHITLAMERDEEVVEFFEGAKINWVWICREKSTISTRHYRRYPVNAKSHEVRSFEVTFHKKHKDMIVEMYFPFIVKQSKEMKQEKKTLKIFTLDPDEIYGGSTECWQSVNLDHPATFKTLAMEAKVKEMVLKDLEKFVERKDKYRRIGKAWKRGYLLYGPPGTGKSSLIAAMANYLNFDIYDLELTDIKRNSELRQLLIATENRSILVVEDIDCTIEFQDRLSGAKASKSDDSDDDEESKVTLSGFLNFIDGLWSSIGDERIIIFTTNHKDKLDPALLRPGRMDMHIHMSYCTPCGFKLLAANYLEINTHERFGEIEELINTTEVTPAEVAEQLLKSDDPDVALSGLVEFLHVKGKANDETKTTQALEEEAQSASKEKKNDNKKDKEKNKESSECKNCHCCCCSKRDHAD